MSRIPPKRTPEQQRDTDRLAALKVGTPDALRKWAERYSVPLFHLDDDELLLISIHEARVELFSGQARKDSFAWLAEHRDRIVAERTTT